ncbi:MAG TPA: signal peptidase I [Kineosporiaceae bacterium]
MVSETGGGGSSVGEGRGSVTWYQTADGGASGRTGSVTARLGVPNRTVNDGHDGAVGAGADGRVNGTADRAAAAWNGYPAAPDAAQNGTANRHVGSVGAGLNGYRGPLEGPRNGVANGRAPGNAEVGVDDVTRSFPVGPPGNVSAPVADEELVGVGDPADARPEPWIGTSMPPRGAQRRARVTVPSLTEPVMDRTTATSRRRFRPRQKPRTALGAAASAAAEVVIVLSMALVLSLIIKTFLVQAFFIPSQSMENTLLIGDRVLVSKLTPGPFALHRGDVIVFKDPGGWLPAYNAPQPGAVRGAVSSVLTFVGLLPQDSGEHLIKRVVGLPGDTVTCCDKAGRIQVNGISINEPYLKPNVAPSETKFRATVRAGQLWVMGDNRIESADSRAHPEINGGQVPISDVVGKAFVVVWPFGRLGGVPDPPGVFAGVPARAPGP